MVIQELLAGAPSAAGKARVELLYRPFEKVSRIVTPHHSHWKYAGLILAQLLRERPALKSKLPALANDCLLALTARSLGAILIHQKSRRFTAAPKQTIFFVSRLILNRAAFSSLVLPFVVTQPSGGGIGKE
ncbi:MAG: type II toxin-antitoxin system VapC family toxin [Deltaproteobacteria bacterium]|nr:type II toxin-antitoxin system VapC family toxin [Deltaproteobacteria bacterium]